MTDLLVIKGTTLATAASVVRESSGEVVSAAANPVIVIGEGSMARGAEVNIGIGNLTVELTLSGADRLSLVELLLGHRITESEARALDGNR